MILFTLHFSAIRKHKKHLFNMKHKGYYPRLHVYVHGICGGITKDYPSIVIQVKEARLCHRVVVKIFSTIAIDKGKTKFMAP